MSMVWRFCGAGEEYGAVANACLASLTCEGSV